MTLPTLIEKCVASPKPGVRSKCLESIILFVELDSLDSVVSEIIPFLSHKQPKVISGSINAITECIKEFGLTEKAAIRTVVKVIPMAFQHADKLVRYEGTNLTLEVYQWIGAAINPFLDTLKPIQVYSISLPNVLLTLTF